MSSAEYYIEAGVDLLKDGMKIINPPKASATPTAPAIVPTTTTTSPVMTYLPYIAGAAVLFFLLRGKK